MLPWGGRVDAIAQKNLSVITPKGTQIPVNLKLNAIKIPSESLQAGSTSITYNKLTKNSAVILNHQIFSPSIWWRLTHP
jgi:hypothetical protein